MSDNAPQWHRHVAEYGAGLAKPIGAECLIERFDAGKSFENALARVRYSHAGLHVIVEFSQASELWVEDDAPAVKYAFSKADPFDGSVIALSIERIRHAFLRKEGAAE